MKRKAIHPQEKARAAREAEKRAAREALDIADGIVPAARRYDQEYLASVRLAAGLGGNK